MERILVGPPLPAWLREHSGETLLGLLERAIARDGNALALVSRGKTRTERWTYAQLGERVARIRTTLGSFGVEAGTRVAVWAPNDPWLVAAYFAVWSRGAAVVPLDLRMQEDVAVRIGRRSEAMLLLAGRDLPEASAVALGIPILRVTAEALAPSGDPATGGGLAADAIDPATVAEILFTSGTTSDPKGVVLSHGQIVHSVRAIALAAGVERQRGLALIPLSHMYGQMVPLLYGLLTNSQITLVGALSVSSVVDAMKAERITALTLVPQLLRILLDGIESEANRAGALGRLRRLRTLGLRLPFRLRRLLFRRVLGPLGGSLRVISCGGAVLPADLQLAWEAMGIRVIQGYGATECAAIAGHSLDSRRPGTVGPPLASMEVTIAADGELLARGPNVMVGYWADPDATAEALAGGWAHTGDAATIDETGELVILGRTRDRIALPNGLKVYPEDLELALKRRDVIRDAVAFETAPGRLAAVLVAAPDVADPELAAAVQGANAMLAPHQRLRAWVRWPESDLPRTHTLKVRRGPVIERARGLLRPDAGGAPASLSPAPAVAGSATVAAATADPTIDALVEAIADVVAETSGGPRPALDAATPIASLDLDSLAAVALALRIEEAFEAAIEDDEIERLPDVAALARLIDARRGAAPAPEPSRWAFSRPARLARRLLDSTITGALVRLVAAPTADGLEHLAGLAGGALICPNHTSHLDAPSLRFVLPAAVRERTAIAAAADYFFSGGPLGPIVALGTGAFPFGRTEHIRASLDRVRAFVDDGWNVLLFPEGTRALDGRLAELREGIGLLATTLGAPVVPAHIGGAHEILPKGRLLPRRRRGARVRIRFGPPLRFGPETSVHEATAQIAAAIATLGEPRVDRGPTR